MRRPRGRAGWAAGVLVALAGGLAACGGTTVTATIGSIVAGPEIVAQDLAFDTDTLEVPANAAFGLTLDNRDSQPHNVSIFVEAGRPLYAGEIFGGPATRTYEVPAIPPGSYQFRCDVHPEMHGTVIAAP